jgi:hypothetical protein
VDDASFRTGLVKIQRLRTLFARKLFRGMNVRDLLWKGEGAGFKTQSAGCEIQISADLRWETIMHGSEGELKEAPYKEGVVQM